MRSLWPGPRDWGRGWGKGGNDSLAAVSAQDSAYFAEIAKANSALNGYAIAWNGCTGGKRPAARSRRTCKRGSVRPLYGFRTHERQIASSEKSILQSYGKWNTSFCLADMEMAMAISSEQKFCSSCVL